VVDAVKKVWPARVASVEVAALRLRLMVPVFETEKSVVVEFAVEEPIAKSVVRVSPWFACTVRSAIGEDEPTLIC
jgi:hypothetical protein